MQSSAKEGKFDNFNTFRYFAYILATSIRLRSFLNHFEDKT